MRFLQREYTHVVRELASRTTEVQQLRLVGSIDSANFEIENHEYEVNSEINRIRAEYT